jgi:hypothetical protein
MITRRRTVVPRDQAASVFSSALLRLCEDTGATAAALVDSEGETVDYAGTLNPFDIKVTAAEWRLVLARLAQSRVPHWAQTHELFVRAQSRSYALIALDAGYAIVLQLFRHCAGLSTRALGEAVQDISREAGLKVPIRFAALERWRRVAVRTASEDDKRPQWVWHAGAWREVMVLGVYEDRDLPRRDHGFRARLASGAEFFLVREPLGRWYADGVVTIESVLPGDAAQPEPTRP